AGARPPAAEVFTYDISMNTTAQPLGAPKQKLKITGTMTWDDESGELTFDVSEPRGLRILGAGHLGSSGKLAIGRVTLEAQDPDMESLFTGDGFFKGKLTKGNSHFSGSFTSVADSFNGDPSGFIYLSGKATAKRRP
ncbi:MAG: hypothetical protein ACO1SX_18580, partial [Actinomycetota bacterium]